MVTDKFAIWLTDAGKLKLSVGQQNMKATIELRGQKGVLHQDVVNLCKGVHQTFDLSQMGDGTYQIQVTIGQEVTTKTIQIGHVQERTIRLG